jgi:uncharacterized protein YhdP
LDIEDGVISKQDPKFGRLLSLLNITAIVDRFKLKAGDVVSDGFKYNTINAKVKLSTGGNLQIEKFNLDSSSSKINISGNTNIVSEKLNIDAQIIPAIKDGIPIITALTGGGAAGLGVWLVDKLLFKDKLLSGVIDNAAAVNYEVSGDWDNPQIKKLNKL